MQKPLLFITGGLVPASAIGCSGGGVPDHGSAAQDDGADGATNTPAFVDSNNTVAVNPAPSSPGSDDPGFSDISGTAAEDFDLLTADSPAVDTGAYTPGNDPDFFNRARPTGTAADIGALEFGAERVECISRFPFPAVREASGLRGDLWTSRGNSPNRRMKALHEFMRDRQKPDAEDRRI